MGVTRIQHNLSAMNAMSNYQGNQNTLTGNLEKLSSGYRINSAADDAAGLAISEKMRSQIAGLEKAQDNANDGISLVQTAEGALTEVNSMLTRLKTLATQSANGTYEDGVDRVNLQEETNALLEEIDRISQSTNFNGINLLDGSLSSDGVKKATGSGEKVVTVVSELAALKTNQIGDTATSGKYSFNLAGTVTSADAIQDSSGSGVIQFTVNYVDADGVSREETLYTSALDGGGVTDASLSQVFASAIAGNANLKQQFTVSVDAATSTINLIATTSGTNGARLTGITIDDIGAFSLDTTTSAMQFVSSFDSNGKSLILGTDKDNSALKGGSVSVTVEEVAKDKTSIDVIDFSGNSANITLTSTGLDGKTIKIGDKTYEFVASGGSITGGDTTKVGDGNIAVNVGANSTATLNNLVSALRENGVKSASVVKDGSTATSYYRIKIGDLDEIKASDNKVDISTSNVSKGIVISEVKAEKASSQFTVTSGSGNKATVTIEYTTAEGETKKVSLGYTTSTNATGNANSLKAAFEENEELNSLFTLTSTTNTTASGVYGTSNTAQIKLFNIEARTAGANGPVINSITTDDISPNSVGNFEKVKDGRDQGQTVALDVSKMSYGDTLTVEGKTFEFVSKDELDSVKEGNIAVILDKDSNENTAANLNLAMKQNGIDGGYNAGTNSFFFADGASITSGSGGLVLQVGDTNDDFQKVSVEIDDMSSTGLGLKGLDISDQEKAGAAIDTIAAAVNKVSMQRGKLGALQNRLDHTLNNLDATQQNIQAAESQIRDVDMAKEMTQYSKNNILVQAAQSMLAQANSLPQGVLSLLQ